MSEVEYDDEIAKEDVTGSAHLLHPELTPEEATLLRGGGEARVPVSQIQVGERILVRPGERLPMDGRVLEGRSAVNQAPIRFP